MKDKIAEAIKEARAELRNKQIEEMAKHCPFHEEGNCLLFDEDVSECDMNCDICTFMNLLYDADYRKKSEGEWGFDGVSWTCSECGEYATEGIKTNFCPNCGARMKGGEK